jgi:phage tail-like protein
MTETKDVQRETYPLPVYNFRVSIGSDSMSFSEVSGISMEYETVTYKHGLSFWEGEGIKKYYYDKYVTITLKKGTVKGKNFLYDWLKDKGSRSVRVSLCDQTGHPVVTWAVAKALPVKLEAPAFNANTNEVSIESLEVMAAGISIEHH